MIICTIVMLFCYYMAVFGFILANDPESTYDCYFKTRKDLLLNLIPFYWIVTISVKFIKSIFNTTINNIKKLK